MVAVILKHNKTMNAMKNTLFALLLTALPSFSCLMAQQNHISAGLHAQALTTLETYFLGPSVAFESTLKNKTTIGIKAGWYGSRSPYDIGGNFRHVERLLSIQPGIKFYSKEAHQGFYFGAHANYQAYDQFLKNNDTGNITRVPVSEIRNAFFGFGVDLGFTTAVSQRLTFGVGMTGDLFLNTTNFEEGDLGIGLGAHIGYKF